MKSLPLLSTLAFLIPAAIAASLPGACSTDSDLPCRCPPGTQYGESATFAVIGAKAKDVTDLISDWMKTAWLGIVPFKFHGPNNKPGSTRTANILTPAGTYEFVEKLTKLDNHHDDGFTEQFSQSNIPVKWTSGNRTGSFSGYWVTLEAQPIFKYETAVRWSIYACETAPVRDFGLFYRTALQNATDILKEQGKIQGLNVAPFSVQAY